LRAAAGGAGIALFLLSAAARAQEPPPQATPSPEPSPKPPLGRFRVGPLYLTPTFRIGTLGVDTNVFYSQFNRRTDFTADGGPGLDLVLPLPSGFRFTTGGYVSYLYFLRTASQRKLNGATNATLDFKGGRTQASAEETYGRSFARPSFEIDRRVLQTAEATRVEVKRRLFGRTSLKVGGERGTNAVPEGETFAGADLHRSLNVRRYQGRAALEYELTLKTSIVLDGTHRTSRFPFGPERDGAEDEVRVGIQTDSTALISGRAFYGRERFRLKLTNFTRDSSTADVDATWHVSPRTHIGGTYRRSLQYSAFETTGPTPTLLTESFGAHLDKELVGQRLRLVLEGTITHLKSDGLAKVTFEDGRVESRQRDDTFRTGTGNLSYLFHGRLRAGVTAGYAQRHSNFSDFGIDGLLLGATIAYKP
jgi:hypothetical protein